MALEKQDDTKEKDKECCLCDHNHDHATCCCNEHSSEHANEHSHKYDDHDHRHCHENNHEHSHHHEKDNEVCSCGCGHCHHNHAGEDESEAKKEIIKICIGAVLVILAFISKNALGWNEYVYYTLLLGAYIILGWEVAYNAIRNLFHGELFDENFLMFIATIGAAALGDYTEAVMVMLFYDIGEFAQDAVAERSRDNISSLMDIAPESARIVEKNGTTKVCKPEEVKVGQLIQVLAGEKVPLDGTIIEGSSFVDMKAITGESVPVKVKPGETLVSGAILLDSVLTIRADKAYEDSTVKKILDLVEHAQNSKAPTERFITKFAKVYTPIVIGLAVLVALIPSLITGMWAQWLHRALIFLVISCPCALVLSVPLAFFAGMGGAAKEGILIKGGVHLETLAKAQAFAFDKTGTITEGVFSVQKVVKSSTSNATEKEILATALAVEEKSTHPIANSLVEYCLENKIANPYAGHSLNVHELSGRGLKGEVDGHVIYAGNDKLMKELGIEINDFANEVGSLVHVAKDGTYLGTILISDKIKDNVPQQIAKLKELGIKKTVMLSGDKNQTAQYIAKTAGLDECKAQLLPQQKVEEVQKLKSQYICAYVGDGINDAPVIAGADIGIAMGGVGSDSAIEASGIVIMTDDIAKIPLSVQIARKTMKIAKQNIVFALSIKVLFMILGALGLAGMNGAIFADVGVALLAVLNSMRAIRK